MPTVIANGIPGSRTAGRLFRGAFLDFRVVEPAGLRSAQDVVPRLGAKPGQPALRMGDVSAYDRPIEHVAGQLDVLPLGLPIRKPDARYGLVLCFALGRIELARLAEELVRVTHPDGLLWVVVWKQARLPSDAPSWNDAQDRILRTGWVDNKILSLGDEIYATRYVRRRHGRQPERNPLPLPRVE